jgi:DNA-binding MarR family transcriptional regulator
MGNALQQRLRQSRFESPAHEAVLNLMVAGSHIREQLERVCEPHGVTPGQYNVLRILRGQPEGYPRCEIAHRMIDRAPDLTRMIDRLATRGLVERVKSSGDRRHSVTRITRRGVELLETLRPAMDALHRALTARLSKRECEELSALLERLYGED